MRAWVMRRWPAVPALLLVLGLTFTLVFLPPGVLADASVQTIPFSQDWSASPITQDDDWRPVPGITGYRGDDLTTATGTDPRTLVAPAGPGGPVLDVIANQSNPDTLITGGVAEFDGIANPTIALQGSGTADAPSIVIAVTTLGRQNIRVRYNVRDIDGSADNAVQQVALQFRLGDDGNFTNVPAGYIADATTGPNQATLVTPIDVVLPAGVNNQPRIELRILTTNAPGNDEWVGIDDIRIDGDPIGQGCGTIDIAPERLPAAAAQSIYEQRLSASGITGPASFSITSGTPPGGLALDTTGLLNGLITTAGTFTFTVTATDTNRCTGSRQYSLIVGPPLTSFRIGEVQGAGVASPFTGQTVLVEGVVTAVTSIGFFVQNSEGATDGDPNTSDALFAYLGGGPVKPPRGSLVSVSGAVVEYRPAGDPGPTLTQIGMSGSAASFTVIESETALPEAAVLSQQDLDPGAPFDPGTRSEPLEKYEGMRVRLDRPARAVSPTGASGTFYAVLNTIGYRPRREAGVERNTELPPVSERPSNDPPYRPVLFDTNPEVFGVNTNGQAGVPLVNVATGATIDQLTGVLDYLEGTYTVRPDAGGLQVTASTLAPVAVRAPFPIEFTAVSMNLERIATTADPVFQYRKVANAIVNYLGLPDLVAVQELASLPNLQELGDAVNSAAAAAGSQPLYVAYLQPSGNDAIHVGFLVKAARVTVESVRQIGAEEKFRGSDLNDRPPLILRAAVNAPNGDVFPVTVVAVHQRSLLDASSLTGDGANARAKRQAQTEYLSKLLGGANPEEPNLPNERVIVLGDFNAYEVNDGYVDVVNGARGAPAPACRVFLPNEDYVAGDYTNLYSTIPDQDRYSYLFRGDAGPLDQILANPVMEPYVSGLSVLHINADFPAALKGSDPVVRYSDHDNPIAYFWLKPPSLVSKGATITGSAWSHEEGTSIYQAAIQVANTSTEPLPGPLLLAMTGVPQGAVVSNRDGAYQSIPFIVLTSESLPAGQSATITVRVHYGGAEDMRVMPALYSARI